MLVELVDRAKWKAGSQKELAKMLGIATTRLSEIKHGTRKPEPAIILQLAVIAELNPAETLFQIMEKLDTDNAELWRIWRPYGDSNPGYRRERAMS
ncbi:helix-turn-helix transcriptional regulator [Acinetobacter sp. WU_MDCI_Axc73]|nr:helix-turn-helix transcriptional regulator [Acinetobacter sp. WU_MDCI_Axc73]